MLNVCVLESREEEPRSGNKEREKSEQTNIREASQGRRRSNCNTTSKTFNNRMLNASVYQKDTRKDCRRRGNRERMTTQKESRKRITKEDTQDKERK
jgi:hypothetical protein